MSTGERTPAVADGGDTPLVGRSAELAAITRSLRDSGSVVIVGPAGVGKTALARAAVRACATDGPPGVATASHAASEVPLGALAPLWPEGRLVAEPDVGTLRGAVEAVLAHRIVMIDDAHRLDPVSATAVHQAVVHGGTGIVVTVRADVRCPDAITTLWKDGLATRVDLGTLTPDETTALAERMLGGRMDAAARGRLVAITGGNPLWLRHLIDGERAAGRLARLDGQWRWDGRPTLSTALEELLVRRIGELTEPERHVLELLALGEPLGLGLLEDLAGANAVEETAERDLVVVRADGARAEARVAHPLYGEVVRAQMSVPRQRRIRGLLVEALSGTGGRRTGDGLRQAVLSLDSDQRVDPDLLTAAAARVVGLGDAELGERLFRAARDAGGGFEAQIGLGHLVMWLHRAEEAEIELARASVAARTPAEHVRAVLSRAQNLFFMLARPVEATRLLDHAIARADAAATTDLQGLRAVLHFAAGEFRFGEPLVRRVRASSGATSVARTLAGWAEVGSRALGGGRVPIETTANAAITASAAAPDTAAFAANITFLEVVGLCLEGRAEAARTVAGRMRSSAGDAGGAGGVYSVFLDGRIALDTGRVRTAADLLTGVRPSFPGHGGGYGSWIDLMIAAATAMAGDATAAAEAMARARQDEHPGMGVLRPQLGWASAWVSAASGATSQALTALGGAATLAASGRQHAVEVMIRHTAVCFGDRSQAAALAALARAVDSSRAHAAAAHAAAWVARDPAALVAVSESLEVLDLLLPATDAAAQASVVFAADRDQAASLAASRRATELAERCERPRTPALTALSSPVTVSAREREVATLAAAGLSNREIARHLGVSLRTVESHIYRACSRLGLGGRAEFVAAVVPTSDPR